MKTYHCFYEMGMGVGGDGANGGATSSQYQVREIDVGDGGFCMAHVHPCSLGVLPCEPLDLHSRKKSACYNLII